MGTKRVPSGICKRHPKGTLSISALSYGLNLLSLHESAAGKRRP